jgi:hypothetical protein
MRVRARFRVRVHLLCIPETRAEPEAAHTFVTSRGSWVKRPRAWTVIARSASGVVIF